MGHCQYKYLNITPGALVGRCKDNLLVDIGKSHPQALGYPLIEAFKLNISFESISPEAKSEPQKTLIMSRTKKTRD